MFRVQNSSSTIDFTGKNLGRSWSNSFPRCLIDKEISYSICPARHSWTLRTTKKGFGWIRNHWNQDFGISVLCVVCPQTETGSFRFFWQGWIRKISDDWDCTKVPSHKRCDEPIYLVHAKQDSGDSCNKLAQFLSHCLLQSNDTSDLCQGFHMGMGQN